MTTVYWILLHKAFMAWLQIGFGDLAYYSNVVNHSWAFIALVLHLNLIDLDSLWKQRKHVTS